MIYLTELFWNKSCTFSDTSGCLCGCRQDYLTYSMAETAPDSNHSHKTHRTLSSASSDQTIPPQKSCKRTKALSLISPSPLRLLHTLSSEIFWRTPPVVDPGRRPGIVLELLLLPMVLQHLPSELLNRWGLDNLKWLRKQQCLIWETRPLDQLRVEIPYHLQFLPLSTWPQ